ncbi:MAG TPA: hypothetical protein IAA64_03585 [Candidatus Ornithocaccomicrobium faecavium]|uniref:DRTGG domain-containing protein n=1 Tax=Candidatus Ornithocaccomicrobium faecavium TaxID=2840890 RepID=A0A9D1TCB9_9FIRM|nr:hypothetical protein [Candidatus Ornithocaccomicrobium faecavium]
MKATEIQKLLDATIVCGSLEGIDVLCGCGSDMMSDVLAFPKEKMVLLTGLTNAHTVRTCELLDVCAIVFVRGKIPGRDVVDEAEEAGIPILTTRLTLYDACGTLFKAGLPGGTGRKHE